MWRSSGVLYLPYIFRTLKRVYKPTVVISTKLLKMSSFLWKHGLWLQRESGVDLSDIYVWRMLRTTKYTVTAVCQIVIAVCALIKTMICFSSERSRSANVGLMLGQCNRRQDNIKYTLWSAWRFCEW